jgi:hypothetical protein
VDAVVFTVRVALAGHPVKVVGEKLAVAPEGNPDDTDNGPDSLHDPLPE